MWDSVCLCGCDRARLCTVGSGRELGIHTLPCPGWPRLAQAWLSLSEDPGTFEKAASQALAVTQTARWWAGNRRLQGLPWA